MKKLICAALVAVMMVAVIFTGCAAPAASEAPASEAPAAEPEAPAAEPEAPAAEPEAPAEEPAAEEPAAGGSPADFTVGVLMKTQNNPYFVDLGNKLKEKLEAEGYNVVGVLNADQDLATEVSMMEQLVTQQVDLIVWNPIEVNGSYGAAELVVEPGIPLIGVDNLCTSPALTTTVYSDNPANGYACGLYVGEKVLVGETMHTVLVAGEKGNAVGKERSAGLYAGLIAARAGVDEATARQLADELHTTLTDTGSAYNEEADIHVYGVGYGNWTMEEGLICSEDMIVANADKLNLIVGENDNMLLGAMTAIENAGLTDKIWIAAAADGQKEAYELIMQEGSRYLCTGLNSPPSIADGAIAIVNDILLNGVSPDSYEQVTPTPAAAVTIENVADFYDPNANF